MYTTRGAMLIIYLAMGMGFLLGAFVAPLVGTIVQADPGLHMAALPADTELGAHCPGDTVPIIYTLTFYGILSFLPPPLPAGVENIIAIWSRSLKMTIYRDQSAGASIVDIRDLPLPERHRVYVLPQIEALRTKDEFEIRYGFELDLRRGLTYVAYHFSGTGTCPPLPTRGK